MTLSSRHRIRNLNPGGLRPSTLPLTEDPHNTEFYTGMGKKHFCFFQTAVIGKRTPNPIVKGSGANHHPGAPASCELRARMASHVQNIRATRKVKNKKGGRKSGNKRMVCVMDCREGGGRTPGVDDVIRLPWGHAAWWDVVDGPVCWQTPPPIYSLLTPRALS